MPIPLIFGIGAAAAAALGVGAGVKGGMKMKEANDSIKASEARNKRNIEQMEKRQGPAQQALESLGRSEKEIEKSFGEFANVFEKIKNMLLYKLFTSPSSSPAPEPVNKADSFWEKLLSVKRMVHKDKKYDHKVLTILGVKIKFRVKKKF